MELVGHVLQAKNSGHHSASVYLDLSKAFNMLDHELLLQKLDHYGVHGITNTWFKYYLKGCSLVAKVTTAPGEITYSNSYDITYGTAQGSCLWPLLFTIFCNDLHLLPLYSKIILFADDTMIFNSHRSIDFLRYTLEHDLQLMSDWFKANKLSLNLTKTVARKSWRHNNPFKLTVDGFNIPFVNSTKFLGVYIDSELSWSEQANYIINKIKCNKRLLNLSKNMLDRHCLKNISYGHIYSHITYGLTAWGSTRPT